MANFYKTIGLPGNYTQTPQEWEAATGNKLINYTTRDGKLDIGGITYTSKPKTEEDDMKKPKPSARPSDLDYTEYQNSKSKSDYEINPYAKTEMERWATPSTSGSMVESSFNKLMSGEGGGFIGSMSGLEAASMRLADAAARREAALTGFRGQEERTLQGLRGQQEYGLQGLRGRQDIELQQLRGQQETGLQGLRGQQEFGLQGSRAQQELNLQKLANQQKIDSEIRQLQLEKQTLGAQSFTQEGRWLYQNLEKQIRELQKQRNAIRI